MPDPAAVADPEPADSPDETSPELAFDPEYVSKLRREAATHRVAAKRAQQELDALKAERMTELERATARVKDLEGQISARDAERRVTALTILLGEARAQYPKLLAREVDPASLELDADGTIRNGEALVKRLRTTYPALFGAGAADAGAGRNAPPAQASMTDLIRRRAGRA